MHRGFLFLAKGALAQMGGSSSTSSGSGSAGRTIGRDTSPLNPEKLAGNHQASGSRRRKGLIRPFINSKPCPMRISQKKYKLAKTS